MTAVFEVRGLGYKIDGRPILDGVDFSVAAGEAVALTGPSGSGKTTLLELLSGIHQPTSGTIQLNGRRLERMVTPAEGVATILQGYGLVGLLTAAENIEVALRANGVHRSEARPQSRQALVDLGLEGHEDQLADELSGGQQQRTAVARALALTPMMLIADEPTAELEPASRTLVIDRLLAIVDRGGSLIIATHDPEVAAVCGREVSLRPVLG